MSTKKRLTAEIYAAIPALIEEGKSKIEIAEIYGVTKDTLQVQCSRRGISLRKGGARPPRVTLSLPTPLTLSTKALLALSAAAKAYGTDEVRLASKLLETIAKDNLYEAVLDTSKEPIAA
jgi:hypothetical protein